MNLSNQELKNLANNLNFNKDNLEKVIRLLDILKFINTNPSLNGKLVLKGGTAINLLYSNLPRLSVDIDLDYAVNFNKEDLIKIKDSIENIIKNYMLDNNYSLNENSRQHYILSSFAFTYINNVGNNDVIKIEINYIDRCHILPLIKMKTCDIFSESFSVLTLDKIELYASKINALLSRGAPRDLFDVYFMIKNLSIDNTCLLRKCLIFYNFVGGNQNVLKLDFSSINKIDYRKIKTQLLPMLKKNYNFDYVDAKEVVNTYLNKILIFDTNDFLFIDNFLKGLYIPSLLFDNCSSDLEKHPMAIYRASKSKR